MIIVCTNIIVCIELILFHQINSHEAIHLLVAGFRTEVEDNIKEVISPCIN